MCPVGLVRATGHKAFCPVASAGWVMMNINQGVAGAKFTNPLEHVAETATAGVAPWERAAVI